jgi:tetratricopeptide (TPR) repeat protein
MWALAVALLLAQANDPVSQGLKALEEGRNEAAVQAFGQALAADPKDYFSHFNLALAYGALRRDPEAAAEYRLTLDLKPGLYEAELNLGMLLMRDKEPADALPLLEAAAQRKPAEFQPRYFLAEAQLQTGAAEKSEENFRLAVTADPKAAEAQLGLAQALARQDKLAEAAPSFRRAAELDPSFHDALLDLARRFENGGNPAEAIAIYREFPNNAGAQERLGVLLLESKQYADAVARLESAYAKAPTAANRLDLAQAYALDRQLDKAVPLLEKAVAENPSDFDLRMRLGRVLRDLKRFPAAAAQFQEAARLKPGDSRAHSELGAVLYMQGEYEQSLANIDRARELGEDIAGNWFLRAIILDRLRQLKPALEAYRRFLALSDGKNPDQEFQAKQRARILQREVDKR